MRWRGKRAESRDEGQPFYLWRERYEMDYGVHYATQRQHITTPTQKL